MALKTTVVGHTSMTTSRVLAIFDETSGHARLVYKDGANEAHVDAPIVPAAPYGLAAFQLKGLSGAKVTYGVGAHGPAGPPEPIAVLGANTATFRPLASGPLRVGLVSCNDIDNRSIPKERRGALWRELKRVVAEERVDLLVHAGDQIYGDGAPVGWSASEGRAAAYRRHYVNAWSHPDVAAVLSSVPNVMMWDDHEIYDGYGSNDNDPTEAAQLRYRAAEQAFREFQVALNPPDRLSQSGFGWVGKYGELAIVAVDGRSQRRWSRGAILGKQQLDDLELRLNELAGLGLKHLFVVVGTPVVYLPLIAAEKLAGVFSPSSVDDIRDGWSASNNRNECRRFLMSLLNFAGHSPKTQVTLLAGDVHVGTLSQIDTKLGFGPQRIRPRLFQITSSGIARPAPSGVEGFLMSAITNGGTQALFNRDIEGVLRKIDGLEHDYCVSHRNFAVIDPSDGHGEWDRNGNLWVHFHVERNGVTVVEQLLPRKLG